MRNLLEMASGLNLFVAPLDQSVDDETLRMTFSAYGELFSAVIARDKKGVSKGYGFVHFCSENDGLRAKEEMNNKKLRNRIIQVQIGHKQKGNCYTEGGRNTTIWTSKWNLKPSVDIQELDSDSDVQSISFDAMTCDLHLAETLDVKARMRKLFETQSFTDVTFFPKNNRRVSISAHRAILAVSSPLFTKMLFEDQNKVTVGEKLEVPISNLSFEAFTCIVKYLYTDEVSFDNDDLHQDILDGAKQFGIYSLVKKCEEYAANIELTSENVCSKLQMSASNKIVALTERCIEFIEKNTLSVIQSFEFEICNSTTVRAICKLQSLNLQSEVELLEAVMKWLHSQPYHERKSLLEPLRNCIRFLNFTAGEMSEILKKYPELMTTDEGLSIILFLHNRPKNPDYTGLPSWLNKNMQKRCLIKEDAHVSHMGVNVVEPNGKLAGKILFPLKPDPGQGIVPELTSLLQMKCIKGFHEIVAIRLSFGIPMSNKCRINSLLIKAHRRPVVFKTTENVQIVNLESVRVEFSKKIEVHPGDILDIEAEAKNIECYKFLQYDETCPIPSNPHFSICISSSPKQGKLYFISEIEYGHEDKPKFPPTKI